MAASTITGTDSPPNTNTPLDPSEIPAHIDNLISLNLHLWPALTVAIQNAWGTSSPALGEDKRAWLAGALSDMFAQNQLRDVEDVEDVLAQVMNDEFETVVDDESLEEVAANIWNGRAQLLKGDVTEVRRLMGVWQEKKGKNVVTVVQGEDVDQETDEEDEDGDTWNGFADGSGDGEDVEMDEAPSLVDSSQGRKKPEPEVDEEGFTKVMHKKR
ncbi:rRNA accumulation- protein [Neophaeococcomyces mojaviensis]|uniref:rRNA accumulation- protein n=1 Tax=Neophaeococcomyces mojaviensis TaxID=3383035 RepID=A0ACC3AFD5_9EURO|nr:rRNA accumulation- protein [Knufia sp. JES_112]